jgi:branched-chain amino acid transport system substrate-binding protein
VLNTDGSVARILATGSRAGRRITVPAATLSDIAVGDGSAWLAAPYDGTVWRIHLTPRLVLRPIDTGVDVNRIAYGDGSVWAASSLQGILVHIEPETERVVRTIAVANTPRDLAIGEGGVWVSMTGRPGEPVPAASSVKTGEVTPLPQAFCDSVFYGGEGTPDYLVASDLPLQGGGRFSTLHMSEAIAFVLRRHRFRAGEFRVAYQSCDDSTSQTGLFDFEKCAANAKSYAANDRVLGVVGPYNSACAVAQSAAHALLARQLGARRVFVLTDGEPWFGLAKAVFFRRSARRLGLAVVGFRRWDPRARGYGRLAQDVAAARPDAVFLGGGLYTNGGAVIRALRARLGDAPILAPEFLPIAALFEAAGSSARGTYVSLLGLTLDGLPPAGRRFVREFGATQPGGQVDVSAVYAAEATGALLAALARSDATRESVLRELFRLRVDDGLVGDYRITRTGDTTSNAITILRAARPGGANIVQGYEGAEPVTVIRPPARLVS